MRERGGNGGRKWEHCGGPAGVGGGGVIGAGTRPGFGGGGVAGTVTTLLRFLIALGAMT